MALRQHTRREHLQLCGAPDKDMVHRSLYTSHACKGGCITHLYTFTHRTTLLFTCSQGQLHHTFTHTTTHTRTHKHTLDRFSFHMLARAVTSHIHTHTHTDRTHLETCQPTSVLACVHTNWYVPFLADTSVERTASPSEKAGMAAHAPAVSKKEHLFCISPYSSTHHPMDNLCPAFWILCVSEIFLQSAHFD
jgi:hypothetical protein